MCIYIYTEYFRIYYNINLAAFSSVEQRPADASMRSRQHVVYEAVSPPWPLAIRQQHTAVRSNPNPKRLRYVSLLLSAMTYTDM